MSTRMKATPATIDEFIARYPKDVQKALRELRGVIRKAAPKAEEAFRYGIPTYRLADTNLVHFSGYKSHIGFYPTSSGIREFKKELSAYQCSKGTMQIPLDTKIPRGLIRRIVQFRIREVLKG